MLRNARDNLQLYVGRPNHTNFACISNNGWVSLASSTKSQSPYVTVRNYGINSNSFKITFPRSTGEFMVAPSTWSTGFSGTATLPSAGLYEIKATIEEANNEAFSFFVNWDGTNAAHSNACFISRFGAGENSTVLQIFISPTGGISMYEDTTDGSNGGTLSQSISYRKIGIA